MMHSYYYVIFATVLFGVSLASDRVLYDLSEDGETEKKARSLIDDLEASAALLSEASLESILNSRSVADPKAVAKVVSAATSASSTSASSTSASSTSATSTTAAGNGSGNGIIDVILNSEAVQAILKPHNFGIIVNSKSFKNILNPKAIEHFLNSKIGKQIISPEMLSTFLDSDVLTSKLTPEFVEQLLESVMGVSGAGDRPEFMRAILDSKVWKALPNLGSLKLLVCSDIMAGKDSGGAAIIENQSYPKTKNPVAATKPLTTTTPLKKGFQKIYEPFIPKPEDEEYLSRYRNPYEYKGDDDSSSENVGDPYRIETETDTDEEDVDTDAFQYTPKKYNPLSKSQISFNPKAHSSLSSSGYHDPYTDSYNDPASAISSGVLGLFKKNEYDSSPYSDSYSSLYPSQSQNDKVNYTLQLLDMFSPSAPPSAKLPKKKKKKPSKGSEDTFQPFPADLTNIGTSSDEFSESASLNTHFKTVQKNEANFGTNTKGDPQGAQPVPPPSTGPASQSGSVEPAPSPAPISPPPAPFAAPSPVETTQSPTAEAQQVLESLAAADVVSPPPAQPDLTTTQVPPLPSDSIPAPVDAQPPNSTPPETTSSMEEVSPSAAEVEPPTTQTPPVNTKRGAAPNSGPKLNQRSNQKRQKPASKEDDEHKPSAKKVRRKGGKPTPSRNRRHVPKY